jgi:hypothetical protein
MSKYPLPDPKFPQHKQCFECGAMLAASEKSCWMCGAEQPLMGKLIEPPQGTEVAAPPTNPWLIQAGIWLAIILVAVVGYGVLRSSDSILATLFAAAVIPTLIVVLLGSSISRAAGKPWTPGTKVGVAAGTFLTTIVVALVAAAVAVLVLFAMFIAMIEQCFRMLGGGH